jgi:hypothetical protein
MPKNAKRKTLADCRCDGSPECHHCGQEMPPHTPIEVQGDYVVAHCLKCRCMTPFPVAKAGG